MDDPLVFARAVHFAATLSVTGVSLFNVFVAQPVLRPPASPELRASVVRRLAWIAWIGETRKQLPWVVSTLPPTAIPAHA